MNARRFLISYAHPRGFGSIYMTSDNGTLPSAQILMDTKATLCRDLCVGGNDIVFIAVSEIAYSPILVADQVKP